MKQLLLILILAAGAWAGELTGKWTGSFDVTRPDGTQKPGPAHMELKLTGQEVTGTAGPTESEQMAISKGKLDGSKLTFEVVTPSGQTIKFALEFDGETIKGSAAGENEDGQTMQAKVDLKRKE